MFKVEDNKKKTGKYLKKLILDKYKSQRQFCKAFLEMRDGKVDEALLEKFTTKISAITRGEGTVQTYDLPIFCELLDVSCEQILSAGKCYKPVKSHITNYEVAFSKDKKVWESYMNREDKLFLNYDEYGKSVVDYALEFHNYDFIKYLMKTGHLNFVDNSKWERGFNFGLSTDIKRREIGYNDIWPIAYRLGVPESLVYEERLRTKAITLAIENHDYECLEELNARVNPAIYNLTIFDNRGEGLEEQRDDELIETIANADEKIIEYYTEEFVIEDIHKREHTFMFPYLNRVVAIMIKNKNPMVGSVLDKAIKHNRDALEQLKQQVDEYTDILYRERTIMFNDKDDDELIKEYKEQCHREAEYWAKQGLYYKEDDGMLSYHYSTDKGKIEGMLTNIISVGCKPKDTEIAEKINELNGLVKNIIELGKHE